MNQILNNNILQWQPVKMSMTYPDFVTTFPRAERIKHCNFTEIDTNTGHTHAKGKRKDNFGEILSPDSQSKAAVKNLKKFILDRYNIELIGPQTCYVHLCHICDHNSTINFRDLTKHTCTNSTHVYFGKAVENSNDVDPVVKSAAAKSPKQNTQVRKKCPYCELDSTELNLTGTHIPSCHFNPTSHNYLKPILHPTKKIIYQQQGLGHKLIELELMIVENYNSRHQ